jgi:hypothetical protein
MSSPQKWFRDLKHHLERMPEVVRVLPSAQTRRHLKFEVEGPGGVRVWVRTSRTPSDHRVLENTKAQVRRLLREAQAKAPPEGGPAPPENSLSSVGGEGNKT